MAYEMNNLTTEYDDAVRRIIAEREQVPMHEVTPQQISRMKSRIDEELDPVKAGRRLQASYERLDRNLEALRK